MKKKNINPYITLNEAWHNLNVNDFLFGLDDIIVVHEWFNISLRTKKIGGAIHRVSDYLADIYRDLNLRI